MSLNLEKTIPWTPPTNSHVDNFRNEFDRIYDNFTEINNLEPRLETAENEIQALTAKINKNNQIDVVCLEGASILTGQGIQLVLNEAGEVRAKAGGDQNEVEPLPLSSYPEFNAGEVFGAAFAPLGNGGFAMVYNTVNAFGPLYFTIHSATGEPVRAPELVGSESDTSTKRFPQICEAINGNLVVSWRKEGTTDTHYSVYDSTYALILENQFLEITGGLHLSQPTADGNVCVLVGRNEAKLFILDSNGVKLHERTITTETLAYYSASLITHHNIIAVGFNYGNNVHFGLYDSELNEISALRIVSATGLGTLHDSALIFMSNRFRLFYTKQFDTARVAFMDFDMLGNVIGQEQDTGIVVDAAKCHFDAQVNGNNRLSLFIKEGAGTLRHQLLTDSCVPVGLEQNLGQGETTTDLSSVRLNDGTVICSALDTLQFVRTSIFKGIADRDVLGGEPLSGIIAGAVDGYGNLDPLRSYYVDSQGNVSQNAEGKYIGESISGTTILLGTE